MTRVVAVGAVALAAAAISAYSLFRLGVHITLPLPLALLLPVAVDALALAAGREWVRGPVAVRSFARALVLLAVAVSVAGNAAAHLLDTYQLVAPWWLIVAVSAVPPLALAAVLHLWSVCRAAERAETVPVNSLGRATYPDTATGEGSPVTPDAATGDPVPVKRASEPVKRKTSPVKRPVKLTDDEARAKLTAAIAAGDVDPGSVNSVRRYLGVGTERAKRLLDEHQRPHLRAVAAEGTNR